MGFKRSPNVPTQSWPSSYDWQGRSLRPDMKKKPLAPGGSWLTVRLRVLMLTAGMPVQPIRAGWPVELGLTVP